MRTIVRVIVSGLLSGLLCEDYRVRVVVLYLQDWNYQSLRADRDVEKEIGVSLDYLNVLLRIIQ